MASITTSRIVTSEPEAATVVSGPRFCHLCDLSHGGERALHLGRAHLTSLPPRSHQFSKAGWLLHPAYQAGVVGQPRAASLLALTRIRAPLHNGGEQARRLPPERVWIEIKLDPNRQQGEEVYPAWRRV
jgi:hypothetical protein